MEQQRERALARELRFVDRGGRSFLAHRADQLERAVGGLLEHRGRDGGAPFDLGPVLFEQGEEHQQIGSQSAIAAGSLALFQAAALHQFMCDQALSGAQEAIA
jgi:hypothetical protein